MSLEAATEPHPIQAATAEVGNPEMRQLGFSGGEGKEGVGGPKSLKTFAVVVNETHETDDFRFHQKLFCCQ